MDDIHTPHSPCGIVEHPLGSILEIHLKPSIGVGSGKFFEQCSQDGGSIVRLGPMLLKSRLETFLKYLGGEAIESSLTVS
jgi:hypothetical protein